MIFHTRPKDFKPKLEVVSCFIEHKGKIILLHRQDHKLQGNTWCLPAGKIEKDEQPIQAIIREVKEETGIEIPSQQLAYLGKVYVRYPEFDFIFHIFQIQLSGNRPTIIVDAQEHKKSIWATPQAALKMELIPDQGACIKYIYKIE